MRVGADATDVLGARARQDGQLEDDVHVHLGDDDEGVAVREGIQRRVDTALDGVFDRDDGPVGLAAAHGRERLGGARHGQEDGSGGGDLVDGLFGKGAEGAEEGDAKLVTEGRGAGNVRRHGVKGIDTPRGPAFARARQLRIVAYRAGQGDAGAPASLARLVLTGSLLLLAGLDAVGECVVAAAGGDVAAGGDLPQLRGAARVDQFEARGGVDPV